MCNSPVAPGRPRLAGHERSKSQSKPGFFASDIDNLRLHRQGQYAFGSQRFRSFIEVQLGRRA